ncbi:SDR family oxidoreductase [Aldersonia sp. NBC_00410]|uniref:SDR family NAD(P)-dependent oxidoreductase n=1 Tax=Aldersonia sp. NBC_00410 TaxID=2975954 RepID=UPI00225510F4|nr:SDR family oxidoreductase [Aldersonia sp. NBC_00410]MCX5044882.1 SDR family oxidoreductase [Aldersonia sp. NBC_00410]
MTSKDAVALVTGAARGQGEAIVGRLLADGYWVAACDHRLEELKESLAVHGDSPVIAVELDVTNEAHWESAVASAVGEFGSLSALINNAGLLHRAAIGDETVAGFESSWRTNCLGPFLGIRAALDELRRAEGAAIVNTCSTSAVRPFPNHAAYGSSKWALRGLTQITAAELAPMGIRVNAILPGPVATPMLDESVRAGLAARSISGRIGQPIELADAVAFLISERASFITGAELVVDGGQCLQIG